MKWTKVIPDGKGGLNIFDDWTNGDRLGSAILPFLIRIPLLLLFGLLLPGITWLIAPFESDEKIVQNRKASIVASTLTTLDLAFGGPIWMFLSENTSHIHIFFGALNLAFLFGDITVTVFYNRGITLVPNVLLFTQVVFVYLSYDIFKHIATFIYSDSLCFWMQAFLDYIDAH